jgi:segregation and condensation protein A
MSHVINIKNFEGPLDLLIYFIRRDELDIYDIPIAKITKDFIKTIEQWKRLNMIVAGDFIVMASTLMRVKAKTLIPRPELNEDGIIIDPREELMNQLIEYSRFKDAAEALNKMKIENSTYNPRQFEQFVQPNKESDMKLFLSDISLFDLAKTFKKAMESKPVISQFELNKEPIKLEDQKKYILENFDKSGKMNFHYLIKNIKTKLEIVVTFLAILDLIKEEVCTVVQNRIFDDINLVRTDKFL